MVKAVIFDVDGVLVDSRDGNLLFYKQLIQAAGYPVPSDEAILSRFHLSLRQTLHEILGVDNTELDRLRGLAQNSSIRGAELNKYPAELKELLTRLHQKYKLAIVTSRLRFGMEEIFDAVAIRELFDVVVTFEDYAKPKPDPEPLLVSLERLGVAAGEAVYIGDSRTDIEAAKQAGVQSIHLTRTPHPDATTVVEEFHELEDAIEALL